jgi:hypothetical protein
MEKISKASGSGFQSFDSPQCFIFALVAPVSQQSF